MLRAMKKALAISYADLYTDQSCLANRCSTCAYQQMAVLGIVVMILGFSPRK